MSAQDPGFQIALEEARAGQKEGGIPIGACLVAKDGTILGRGRNVRVQKGSAILHAEMAALEDSFSHSGPLPASVLKGATMYTTLCPCEMCTGACIFYGLGRVVMAENDTWTGTEVLLESKGIEVVNLKVGECTTMMTKFREDNPELWKARRS